MGDPLSPHAVIHPPPPPPTRSNLPMFYYVLVIIGTAVIILGLYNLLIVQWCADIANRRSRHRRGGSGPPSSWRFRNSNINPISSFKYRREDEEGGDTECAVCLSVFEQGEELRRMPKCKHSFHAPCIDMWLYSHMDCPLCRSPVGPPGPTLHQSEHSRPGTLV